MLYHPTHSYTKALLRAVPKLENRKEQAPVEENGAPVLEVKHVDKNFREPGGRRLKALEDLSLTTMAP